jgi:hypothetical protein
MTFSIHKELDYVPSHGKVNIKHGSQNVLWGSTWVGG